MKKIDEVVRLFKEHARDAIARLDDAMRLDDTGSEDCDEAVAVVAEIKRMAEAILVDFDTKGNTNKNTGDAHKKTAATVKEHKELIKAFLQSIGLDSAQMAGSVAFCEDGPLPIPQADDRTFDMDVAARVAEKMTASTHVDVHKTIKIPAAIIANDGEPIDGITSLAIKKHSGGCPKIFGAADVKYLDKLASGPHVLYAAVDKAAPKIILVPTKFVKDASMFGADFAPQVVFVLDNPKIKKFNPVTIRKIFETSTALAICESDKNAPKKRKLDV